MNRAFPTLLFALFVSLATAPVTCGQGIPSPTARWFVTADVQQDSAGTCTLRQNSAAHPVKAAQYGPLHLAWFDGTGTDLGSNNQSSPPNGDYPYLYRLGTLLGSRDGTVAFWMKRTGRSIAQPFGGHFWERGVSWGYLQLQWNENNDELFTLCGVGVENTTYTPNLQSTNWTHIAVTRAGGTIRVYRDGALVNTGSAGPAGGASATVVGGTRAGHGYFVGYFHDYNVWVDTVLDSAQIQGLYRQKESILRQVQRPTGLSLKVK